MINEEPVLALDRAMMDLLLPLGIETGKEFKPDAEAHPTWRNRPAPHTPG